MPLVPAGLTYPVGKLRAEWFPDEDLSANLTEWLQEGESQVPAGATTEESDAIVRAYAYWRGFESVADRLGGAPTSANVSEGGSGMGRTISDKRVSYFDGKAAEWRAAFDSAVGVAGSSGSQDSTSPRVSQTVEFSVSF